MSRKTLTRELFTLAALALATVFSGSLSTAAAAGIVVNSLADGSVSGSCTLRDAVQAGSTGTTVNGCQAPGELDKIAGVTTASVPIPGAGRRFPHCSTPPLFAVLNRALNFRIQKPVLPSKRIPESSSETHERQKVWPVSQFHDADLRLPFLAHPAPA